MDHVARDEKNADLQKNSQKQKKDSRKESQKEIKWRVENKISIPNLFINIHYKKYKNLANIVCSDELF